jgi:hypothetical protein
MMNYGNGFTMMDLYKLPTHLRNFYYNKLADAKKKEADAVKKSSQPSKSSKVRIK